MDVNQKPSPIIGERALTQQEVAAVNYVRECGFAVANMLQQLAAFPSIDMRLLAVARTDLQKGFEFAERAVAQPEKF